MTVADCCLLTCGSRNWSSWPPLLYSIKEKNLVNLGTTCRPIVDKLLFKILCWKLPGGNGGNHTDSETNLESRKWNIKIEAGALTTDSDGGFCLLNWDLKRINTLRKTLIRTNEGISIAVGCACPHVSLLQNYLVKLNKPLFSCFSITSL
jgi:hypothetical protein